MLKISNYKNHIIFSLRCLSKGVIAVSLKLKNNIRTYKSNCLIHQDEKKLLNESIRNINNSTECLNHFKYMYECDLKVIVGLEMFKKCEEYIETAKETRHNKVLQ